MNIANVSLQDIVVWLVLIFFVVLVWWSIGPAKAPRQGCWYCRQGHEHGPWLNAFLCDLIFRRKK